VQWNRQRAQRTHTGLIAQAVAGSWGVQIAAGGFDAFDAQLQCTRQKPHREHKKRRAHGVFVS
jgi:hypothetical protein